MTKAEKIEKIKRYCESVGCEECEIAFGCDEGTFESWADGTVDTATDKIANIHPDAVNHPPHYTQGRIECIDYLRDKLTQDEFRGYCKGNVIKYVTRERLKNGDEDLKKAMVYLNFLLEEK